MMKANKIRSASKGTGLLASGCAGKWCVEIDQGLDSDEHFAKLDGASFYFYFELAAGMLRRAVDLLGRPHLPHQSQNGRRRNGKSDVKIGRFAGKPVTLIRDSEFGDRCFLVIHGPKGTALNYTFAGSDFNDLAAALRQAADELSESD